MSFLLYPALRDAYDLPPPWYPLVYLVTHPPTAYTPNLVEGVFSEQGSSANFAFTAF
jgi:hypothetical protein